MQGLQILMIEMNMTLVGIIYGLAGAMLFLIGGGWYGRRMEENDE